MQSIREEEIKIDVIERHKRITIEEKEAERMEKELVATVKLPAEAEAYRVKTLAEGKKYHDIEEAKANAAATKKLGEANAAVVDAVGKAEAERLLLRAAAFSQYGDVATTALVLEQIPEIARNLTKPLSHTSEVLIVGTNDSITSEIARLSATLPSAVKSVTGFDVSKALSKAFGSDKAVAV
ncbi:hypothetical protein AB6A40_007205 [Gnathostoma spinigerum]|uniref:Flotillin-like n=1 Tax=Gnathostoma spinigerum TaxID=75299 RepID=A0ABD6EL44_9BILA